MRLLLAVIALGFASRLHAADLIVMNARIVTVDAKSSIAEAIAITKGRIIAVGKNADMLKHRGPETKVIDAGGKTVLPGLMDSHTHPFGAAVSEMGANPPPNLKSLEEVFAFIRKEAERKPAGQWIVIRYAFPTRLKEARFPTKAELDEAAPNHPVLYHAGPAGVANSVALKISGVTKDTKNPPAGQVVKDATTGEPTGMLRNAYGVLKDVPGGGDGLSTAQKQAAVRKLFALYNAQGLTSIAERSGSGDALAAYRGLKDAGELTLRVNFAHSTSASGSAEEIGDRLDKLMGPTGAGDEWLRIGPLKFYTDGGMLNGTAYMRQPWPAGATYQVTQSDYRGLLFIQPEQLKLAAVAASKRKWQMTSHTAGESGMDVLLDAYEFANRTTPIKPLRFCITHANFPSQHNLERCKELGVVADIQPAWLWKDGKTLLKELGPERMRWFQPYKSWLQYTTIGGGSDHMLRFDPVDSINPWSPWIGIWEAVTRQLEHGGVHQPDEKLTREQAIRLYTINNAYLTFEEKEKGSLEVGKLGDLIVIDRDVLTCPTDDIRETKVLTTIVGGKVVYEAPKP